MLAIKAALFTILFTDSKFSHYRHRPPLLPPSSTLWTSNPHFRSSVSVPLTVRARHQALPTHCSVFIFYIYIVDWKITRGKHSFWLTSLLGKIGFFTNLGVVTSRQALW